MTNDYPPYQYYGDNKQLIGWDYDTINDICALLNCKPKFIETSWDGMLHQLNVADGEDVKAPAKFMPPNGKPYALNLWNNVIYTHTAQGCGGNPNVVYAYDLATNKVGS